jgi:hypothetical protein
MNTRLLNEFRRQVFGKGVDILRTEQRIDVLGASRPQPPDRVNRGEAVRAKPVLESLPRGRDVLGTIV